MNFKKIQQYIITIKNVSTRASITIEAAISLPVFIIAVLSITALIQYPITYQAVGHVLSDVAKIYSSGGYIASFSGLSSVNAELQSISEKGIQIGSSQIEEAGRFLSDLGETVQTKKLDEFSELRKLFVTQSVQTTADGFNGIFNPLTMQIATKRLRDSSKVQQNIDPWLRLGIKGGEKGIDLSNSIYYGDNGTIEIIAIYTIKPSALFKLAPSIVCSNRIHQYAWSTGVGTAIREYEAGKSKDDMQTTKDSIWNTTENKSLTLARGNTIENEELEKLEENAISKGITVVRANTFQPGYDALYYKRNTKNGTAYDVFSLNPFLVSYKQNPSRLRAVVNEKLNQMPQNHAALCLSSGVDMVIVDRELTMVVPENTPYWVDEVIESLQNNYRSKGVQLKLVKGYGEYDE